jgi:hypothetical protein
MPGYDGPDHCPKCHAEAQRQSRSEADLAGLAASIAALPPVEAALAMAVVEAAANGTGLLPEHEPAQIPLIDTAKPFNLEGAFTAIAEKNTAVKWAHDRYEASKEETAHLRKTWESQAKQLQELIDSLADRQRSIAQRSADALGAPERDDQIPSDETSDSEAIASGTPTSPELAAV